MTRLIFIMELQTPLNVTSSVRIGIIPYGAHPSDGNPQETSGAFVAFS